MGIWQPNGPTQPFGGTTGIGGTTDPAGSALWNNGSGLVQHAPQAFYGGIGNALSGAFGDPSGLFGGGSNSADPRGAGSILGNSGLLNTPQWYGNNPGYFGGDIYDDPMRPNAPQAPSGPISGGPETPGSGALFDQATQDQHGAGANVAPYTSNGAHGYSASGLPGQPPAPVVHPAFNPQSAPTFQAGQYTGSQWGNFGGMGKQFEQRDVRGPGSLGAAAQWQHGPGVAAPVVGQNGWNTNGATWSRKLPGM